MTVKTMQFSDEILMAYADGELDAETRRQIEAAMADDRSIAERVAQHQSLRADLGAAFAPVLDEPIPQRLLDATKSSPTGRADTVVDLAAARAARMRKTEPRRWSWPEWTAIAASLLIGVLAGRTALQSQSSTLLASTNDGVVATGALAKALSDQASGPSDSAIGIGLSFRAKNGEYCRTFTAQSGTTTAGFACREQDAWRVRALTESAGAARGGEYKMASTSLPPSILQAVDDAKAGDALDAAEETAARERGWR
jgi:hypothetical protein